MRIILHLILDFCRFVKQYCSDQLLQTSILLNICLLFRKKYVQRLQIRHSYGDNDDEEEPLSEETAVHVTQAALADGTAPALPVLVNVPAPNGAQVENGGKRCKWCGSSSHLRKSHRDCPYNSTRS